MATAAATVRAADAHISSKIAARRRRPVDRAIAGAFPSYSLSDLGQSECCRRHQLTQSRLEKHRMSLFTAFIIRQVNYTIVRVLLPCSRLATGFNVISLSIVRHTSRRPDLSVNCQGLGKPTGISLSCFSA